MKTYDVVTVDDFETWGGPGQVVRIPSGVRAKYRDEIESGSIEEAVKDPRTTVLWIDGLLEIYDYLRKAGIQGPKLQRLMDGTTHFEGKLVPAGDPRPAKVRS